MASDIEQRNFVDKDGLEQFWDDIQAYMTRMYKGLPAGMQFSRIYQQNGQLHILVEPFGGDTLARKEASRNSLDVYSKAEIDANYKTKQDGVSEQFTEYQTLLDISQDTNGEISVRKQAIPTATVETLGLTTLKGVVSADDDDNSNAATPKAVADAITAAIEGLDVVELEIGQAKTVGTIEEVDGKIVVTAVPILVDTPNIADNAVTSAKIADGTIQSGDIGAGQIKTTNIEDAAVTGTKIASETITSANIQNGTIQSADIGSGEIHETNIANDAVTNDKVADNAIGTAQLINDAVNGDKIADDAIGNEHIADDAVHTEQILDGSVTTGKIANDAVTADKVKDGETLPVDISGNAATATTVEEGGELDRRIGALETGKKDKQEAKADPSNSGNTENFQFISTITQNANGEITATKHTIPKSDSYTLDSSTTLATSAAVKAAVDASHSEVSGLNVENDIDAGEFITSLSQDAGLLVYSTDTMETGPVENSLKPVTGNALYEESHERTQFDDWIRPMIPGAASGQNQLADKAYVDAIGERLEARYLSSYDAEHDVFIPFPTYAAFDAVKTNPSAFYYNGVPVSSIGDGRLDNNDVIVITADEEHLNDIGGPSTTRYRYQCDIATGDNGHWYFEYVINNTALNEAQLLAINSGITRQLRESYDTHLASNGHDGNPANPHRVTFDQLEGRNGVTSTELGVLDGVDTRHVGSDQLNTLKGIHIEEGVTIQSQLDDKVERVSPKYSPEEDPEYTASGKIAIIDDNADVNGRFGVEDSGAEIVANYNGNDTINPATGSAIKEAIDALDATVDSTHQGEKVLVTVTETNGLLNSVVVDDSNAATAAQGAKADTAIQTVSVLDNGGQSSHILVPDANNGVTVDLSDYKRKQDPVVNPTAQGTSLTFIDTISQDDEGVITPTRKSVTVDGDYIVDGTNPASGTAITNALHTLEATVDSTGGTNVGLQVVETNGIITGVTVSDSSINANDLNSAINALDASVDSTGGTNVAVQVVEADGVITGVTVSDNTVNPTDLANAIDALDATVDSTGGVNVNVQVVETNGVITGVTVDDSSINAHDLETAIAVKADKVVNATAGNLATLDNTGNLVDSGKHVTSAYRDTTQEEGHEKDEYLSNPVTGTAVDAAIAESASSDRQYVDDKIAALDAEILSNDGTNVQVKVTEVDGVITGVSVDTDNTINATDLSTAINALDSTVATETAGEPASNKNFGISVSEENGVLTGVSIIRDNTINANDLSTAINALDATVATETAGTPDEGKNFGISVSEENGVLTGVSIIRDDTVNATDVSNAISSVVNDLNAEVTSSDGTNVQMKVTEEAGVITGVNITTDNTVNATDVANKVATEIGKLAVDNITGFGADKTLATLTETDGKIAATFQSILVDTANIKPDAVKTAQIADDAVTSEKIGEGEVKTANIADSAVTTVKINDSAVTTAKINDSAVTTAKINDSAVTTDKIYDAAVTSEKIGEGEVKTINIDDEAVTTAKIDDEAVTTAKIDDSAVTTAKIKDSAVTTEKINNSAVTTAKINDSAVTTDKIDAGAVTTVKIADEAVTTAKIDDSAVTTAKINDSAVTTAKIADDAVTNDKIADNAVDTAQIKAGAVTYDKVTNDPENPFPIDISGNATHADDASHADVADDVSEGSVLDQRLDTIEENISDLDSTKADKVTGATEGNFAGLDANGNLTDSGHKHSDYKTKQTAVTKTGAVLKTLTSLTQNANGEIDAIFSDIQSATTAQKGVVQLAGSIGATVASENNKAASEKAVRDAIDGVVDGLDAEVTSSDGTNVQVKVTEVDGKITAVNITTDETEDKNNKVTSWSDTTTDVHYPSEKLVKGSLDEKADKVDNATDGNFAGLDANGNLTDSGHKHSDYKTKQEAVADPTVSGSTLVAIDSISQDTNGVVTATKKNIQSATTEQKGVVQLAGSIGATVSSENNKAASEKAVRDAINALDVSDITENLGVGKTITALSESDGKISATASDIQITESQVTGLTTDLASKEDLANKVASWSATTTDAHYPTEKLVKDSLDTKVDKTTKVNGHALSGDVTVTKGDVGLGSVVNTGDSDTPVSGGTTKFTTGGAYTELNKKADKTATVSNVAYDSTNKKITKTINGTTSDVVTAATLKADMALDNVANTNITVSATDGVTDNTNNVTYKYTHPTFTAKTAAAKKVGMNAEGHVVLGDSLTKADVGLGLVSNQTITVTDTSVSDGTHTFNKYVHPTTTATAAAAVKVGNDAEGHVVLGAALQKGDVGLGNVDNTSDANKPVSTAQQAALNAKLDKTAGVTAVTWDSTNKKITKTINGTTSDVVTAATLKTAMALDNVTNDAQVKRSEMGVANGVATLDSEGKVPASQLPSYIDDVIEGYYDNGAFYEDSAHTVEIPPESGKVYVDKTTNLTYRWSGTAYVKIASDLALGETESTAYRGDRGKTAYDHSQLTSGNPHKVTKTDVGLGNVVNTGDSATPVSGGTTKFTTGGAYTELNKKADKTATVSNVAWDATNKKLTKTINGTTSDVVTASTIKTALGLTKSDVGLGNVDNTSDATKKANFTGAVASGNTGFPTGGDVYTAIADGKECVVVTLDTPYSEVAAIVNAGKFPVLKYIDMYFPLTMVIGGGDTTAYWFYSTRLGDPENYHTSITIMKYVCKNATPAWSSTGNTYLQNNAELVSSWSTTVSNSRYPSEKLVKTSLDKKVDKVDGMGLSSNDYTTEEKTKLAGIAAGAEVNQNAFSNVKVGSTTVAADSKTDTLELVAGSNVTITPDATNDKITIAATDTTYESKAAASGGTDVSLVTTGEKYIWNSKQDALAAQTAYTSKGTATKVPQITTNALGQVTGITEVTITGVTPASHTHGNITNAGAIGTASGQAVYTTTNGVLTAGSLATTDPAAEGNALEFIATVSQDAKGKITATKKTVSTMGAASSSAAGTAGLVPAPGSGKQGAFLRGDGTWQTPADSKVTQNLLAATTDAEYPVILKNSTTATDSPTSTENYAAGITVNPKNKSVTATKFVGSLEGTANTAKAYDTSFTGTNSIKSALDGKASSTHTHGNITNAGALQTTDVDIASGDKLVITDSSNSNKVARTSTSFDGNTVTKALTPKGTFEDFAKQADIDTAIEEIPSLSLVGDNHITVTTDDDTGTVTIATDLASQTAYTAKGSATKVPQITTNALGQVTGITEVTISGVAPAAHAHGNISNSGAIGTTSGQAVYTTTDGMLTAGSLATSDPAASGNALSFIATVSQDAKGKITATKKSVTVDSTYSSTGTNPVNGKAIAAAIGTLDVTAITGGTGKTITSISETDGKISATYSNISITKSQVSDFSHAHGNITNAGGITADAVTVASGDAIVVVDSSDSSKKVVKSSISFDGSTTTQALTKAGTWATFNNYSHPAGSAASKTGNPTGDATLDFGGSFTVSQVKTDSTSHVSSLTDRTITLPSLGTTATTAAAGNHTHATSIAASSGTNQLSLAANTKYAITAGGTAFVFTTPKDTTYSSKAAASGGTDVSLVTTGEKYTWNSKQDALTEMTTQEVSDLVAAFAS